MGCCFCCCNLFLLLSALILANVTANYDKLPTGGLAVSVDPTRVQQISWHPRAFIYNNFLTDEECDHLIVLAKDKLERSRVIDHISGTSKLSEVRTSSGMFLRIAQDEVVSRIESKIAAWTFLPEENGESIQILHYEHGEKYEPHHDYFYDMSHRQGGQRMATVLMYLSNVKRGGETVFPESEAKDAQPNGEDWSDCAKEGYAVKPQKGDALLFFGLNLDTTNDPTSLHGSCPVIEGEKWSATKWIHVRSYKRTQNNPGANGCVDMNKNCARWAADEECTKNPVYMVGSEDVHGNCRKSCKVCS